MGDQITAQRTLPAPHHLRHNGLHEPPGRNPIGPYIVDFLCYDPMLVIEIDGSQHTGLIAYDAERSSFLERRGFKVIRFWNHEVLAQTDWVREAIGSASTS